MANTPAVTAEELKNTKPTLSKKRDNKMSGKTQLTLTFAAFIVYVAALHLTNALTCEGSQAIRVGWMLVSGCPG